MEAEDAPEKPDEPFRWRKLLLYAAVWTLVMGGPALYYGWRWLAFDEPEVLLTCNDGTSQCSSGESNNRTTAIVFAVMWFSPVVLFLAVVVWALRLRAQQRRSREDAPG